MTRFAETLQQWSLERSGWIGAACIADTGWCECNDERETVDLFLYPSVSVPVEERGAVAVRGMTAGGK